jgi:hypothetical protein
VRLCSEGCWTAAAAENESCRWQGLETARNESGSPLVVPAEARCPITSARFTTARNDDKWFLCRDGDGRGFVLHKANVSSGGSVTKIDLGDFLGRGKTGPEHQALARLIGSLVDWD